MNIYLPSDLELFVRERVDSGRYTSAAEVVKEGLRLLQRDEGRRLLEKWLTKGLTAEEEAQLPAGVLEKARALVSAGLEQGSAALERGEGIDGEEARRRVMVQLDRTPPTSDV